LGHLGVGMPADFRNVLDYVITAWHTRSLLAKLARIETRMEERR